MLRPDEAVMFEADAQCTELRRTAQEKKGNGGAVCSILSNVHIVERAMVRSKPAP